MPPPANTTALTAVDVGSAPATVTQDVVDHDTNTAYSVWHSFTPAVSNVYGYWSHGDFTNPYSPRAILHTGPASAPVEIHSAIEDTPAQFYLESGTTYYIQSFISSGAGMSVGDLTLDILGAPTGTIPAGSIIINDDSGGFPAAIIDPATGEVVRFIQPFPAGEHVARLANGRMLFTDEFNDNYEIYDANLNHLSTTAIPGGGRYYVAASDDTFFGGDDTGVVQIDEDGTVFGSTLTIDSSGLWAIGASPDGSTLYYINSGTNEPVQRWDVAGNTALSDLVGGVTGFISTQDILVMADGSVIVGYNNFGGGEFIGRHYSSAGSTLHSYTFEGSPNFEGGDSTNRLARIPGDETSFWTWTHIRTNPLGGSDVSRFQRIRISDGAVLDSFEAPVFELGVWEGDTASVDAPRFGHSFSCPFLVLSADIIPPAEPGPTPDCPCFPPGGGGGGDTPPGTPGDGTPPEPIPTIPPVSEFEGCEGLGLVPTMAPYVPIETWWGL